MRWFGLSLVCLAMLVLGASPASAGGWWTTLDLQGRYLGVGESLEVGIHEVMWDSIGEAERAETIPFYAYLVRDFDEARLDAATRRADPGDWWRALSPPILVGEVTLKRSDSNLTRGVAHLDVPVVAPGRYFLMLCDEGCRTPLANHVPTPVNVTTDPLAAQTARKLDRRSERIQLALARLRRDLRGSQRALAQAELDAAEAVEAVGKLQERSAERPENETPWIAYAGWFLAGGATALLLLRGRRSKGGTSEMPVQHTPDDARELLELGSR